MDHIGRAAPVGQGDHDELVDRAGEQRAELANPRVVGAIAPADGERALVEPQDVAPLQPAVARDGAEDRQAQGAERRRSEEHTSELQSQSNLVCRLLLEKQKVRTPPRRTRANTARRPATSARPRPSPSALTTPLSLISPKAAEHS